MKYSKEILNSAVELSVSMAEVLRRLGLKVTGGSHTHIKKRINEFNIKTDHFLGKGANCGDAHRGGNNKKQALEILIYNRRNGCREHTSMLRRAMLEHGFTYKCNRCSVQYWLNRQIILEIHHKNNDCLDNTPENLEFLCPNCHSQKGVPSNGQTKLPHHCKDCNKEIKAKNGRCRSCAAKNRDTASTKQKRKVENRPSKQKLVCDVNSLGYSGTGRKYGVSDNCIRKWLKS